MQSTLPYTQIKNALVDQIEWSQALGHFAYIIIGFSAIQSLALHIIGWVPLHLTAPLFVLPMLVLALLLGTQFKALGRLALMGFFAGIIAVTIFDVSRVPFAIWGVWGDFIPKIGSWALNQDDAPAVIGYSWRYVGNGGGMGVAFIMLNSLFKLKSGYTVRGLFFGIFVFFCLVATLLISPNGENLMFKITPITFAAGLLGHIIYGYILGMILDHQNNIQITPVELVPTSC